MNRNVGTIDQISRIIFGVVISTFGVFTTTGGGLLGFIPLVTGTMSWCPLYELVGLSTLKSYHSVT